MNVKDYTIINKHIITISYDDNKENNTIQLRRMIEPGNYIIRTVMIEEDQLIEKDEHQSYLYVQIKGGELEGGYESENYQTPTFILEYDNLNRRYRVPVPQCIGVKQAIKNFNIDVKTPDGKLVKLPSPSQWSFILEKDD